MSLRKAINEKCAECIYDKYSADGKLQQIEACTSMHCPLYEVRPLPKKRVVHKEAV